MIIVIVGPTGVGKTKLSIMLAKKYNCEIINGDSTQVYRGLDIATAKVTSDEMEGIKHHLIDIKDVSEDYSVYDFQKDCRNCIEDIISRGKNVIICGGTGLYIKACLYDYNFSIDSYNIDYSDYTNDELYNRVISIDPNSLIHVNNRKRLERFLSVYDSTGNILCNKKSDKLIYDDVIFIGLTTSRDILYNRIDSRVDIMVNNGLLDEAYGIYSSNIRSKAIMTPIGYKELFDYFDGNKSIDECISLIKRNSRRYAKRQYTWFNNQMNVNWFNVNFDDFSLTYNDVVKFIDNK